MSLPAPACAARIVRALAARYGQHPAVIAWQTDNGYGCHDTLLCSSEAAPSGFRGWLEPVAQDQSDARFLA